MVNYIRIPCLVCLTFERPLRKTRVPPESGLVVSIRVRSLVDLVVW